MVRKSLRPIGGSYGIIIPKLYLEEMGINPVLHDVDIEVKDKVLMVKKLEKEKDNSKAQRLTDYITLYKATGTKL